MVMMRPSLSRETMMLLLLNHEILRRMMIRMNPKIVTRTNRTRKKMQQKIEQTMQQN